MKPTIEIEYCEEMFPVFLLPINYDGEVHVYTIATESLQDKLMTPGMMYRDIEAENIDAKIFFYIPDKLAEASEREIINFVENNLN